jgi:hypothetical protein
MSSRKHRSPTQDILIFVVVLLMFFYLKPSFLFKPNGKPREYGMGVDAEGYRKTVFSMHTVIIVIVVFIVVLNK